MLPTMTPVESSNIHSIGHDGTHTYVTFKDKAGNPVSTYRYHDVSAEKHAELAAADSVGKHLNAHFKGQHETTQIVPEQASEAAE